VSFAGAGARSLAASEANHAPAVAAVAMFRMSVRGLTRTAGSRPLDRDGIHTGDGRDHAILLLFCPTCQRIFGIHEVAAAQLIVSTGLGYCAWGCFRACPDTGACVPRDGMPDTPQPEMRLPKSARSLFMIGERAA